MRNHASWGSEYDVMMVFLNKEAYDKFRLSEEDYALLKEVEEQQKKASAKKEDSNKGKKEKKDTAVFDKRHLLAIGRDGGITALYAVFREHGFLFDQRGVREVGIVFPLDYRFVYIASAGTNSSVPAPATFWRLSTTESFLPCSPVPHLASLT